MKWFNKWLAKSIKSGMAELDREIQNNRYAEEASPGLGYANQNKVSTSRSPQAHGMNFTIYPANGGHILEYSYNDPKTDRHTSSLHIITADQNMGEVIGHAITFEMLKR